MGVSLFFYIYLYEYTSVAIPKTVWTHNLCFNTENCRDARLVRPIGHKTENLDSEASRLSRTSRKTIHPKKSGISGITTKKTTPFN